MRILSAAIRRLPMSRLREESGQDSIEYAIMIGIVAVAVIGFVGTISGYATSVFSVYAATI
jgi:Flp pilus assembly pilin Flp